MIDRGMTCLLGYFLFLTACHALLCLLRVFGSPGQGSSAVFDLCFGVSTSLTGSGFLAALPHACACLNASTLRY